MKEGKQDRFGQFAKHMSALCGRPAASAFAAGFIVIWALSGPFLGFSETWQLVVNTTTTIITFLMVFLIQHTQNKDTNALQIKLDELIRATAGAHNALLDIEEFSEEEIERVRDYYARLGMQGHKALDAGKADTNKPKAGALSHAALMKKGAPKGRTESRKTGSQRRKRQAAAGA